jgi:hypothetical protein
MLISALFIAVCFLAYANGANDMGAMVGSKLVATSGNINPVPLLHNFILPLLLSPIASLLLAALLYRLQHKLSVFNQPCTYVNSPTAFILQISPLQIMAVDFSAMPKSLGILSRSG